MSERTLVLKNGWTAQWLHTDGVRIWCMYPGCGRDDLGYPGARLHEASHSGESRAWRKGGAGGVPSSLSDEQIAEKMMALLARRSSPQIEHAAQRQAKLRSLRRKVDEVQQLLDELEKLDG